MARIDSTAENTEAMRNHMLQRQNQAQALHQEQEDLCVCCDAVDLPACIALNARTPTLFTQNARRPSPPANSPPLSGEEESRDDGASSAKNDPPGEAKAAIDGSTCTNVDAMDSGIYIGTFVGHCLL